MLYALHVHVRMYTCNYIPTCNAFILVRTYVGLNHMLKPFFSYAKIFFLVILNTFGLQKEKICINLIT